MRGDTSRHYNSDICNLHTPTHVSVRRAERRITESVESVESVRGWNRKEIIFGSVGQGLDGDLPPPLAFHTDSQAMMGLEGG